MTTSKKKNLVTSVCPNVFINYYHIDFDNEYKTQIQITIKMPFFSAGREFGTAKDAVSNVLADAMPKSKKFSILDDDLFAARIMEITNYKKEDYMTKLICFDKDMRKRIVNIHSHSLDWFDFISTNKKHHTEDDARLLAYALSKYDEIESTTIVRGTWASIDCETRYWVRARLAYFTRKRGFLSDIILLNEIMIGNKYLPSNNINHFGKAKVEGIPLFEWFNVSNMFRDSLDISTAMRSKRTTKTTTGYRYIDEAGNAYNYSDKEDAWLDDDDEITEPPLDEDTIHVWLKDVQISPDLHLHPPTYPWVCHDIEVSNSDVLHHVGMPDIKNLDSQINTISFNWMNAHRSIKRFSVVMSPFTHLPCAEDLICVQDEKSLME